MINDISSYNDDPEHNMWVDFDNYENTGTPDVFNESDLDNFIDNLNNRGRYGSVCMLLKYNQLITIGCYAFNDKTIDKFVKVIS